MLLKKINVLNMSEYNLHIEFRVGRKVHSIEVFEKVKLNSFLKTRPEIARNKYSHLSY